MDILRFQKYFRGAAPDHDQPVALVVFLEVADVFAELLGKVEFIFGLLDVGSVQILHVVLVERGLHGLDGLKKLLDLREVLGVEHSGL